MSKDDALADVAQQLHSVAIHLLRRLRRTDDQMGLSGPRASALSVLVFGGPASLAQLAKAEQVKPPTMVRIVDALEASGLARREADKDDLRAVRIRATAKGRKLLLEGRARRVRQLINLLEGASAAERTALADTVSTLQRLLKQPDPDSD
ncbi:MAG TPA: MarR family transcriptional regulator [Steroidobacteraceae bacterium]|jgi:Transcriptional regulators|nr:MarR family transcriptional regulator [Steroidobacteraceae bacterium]